MIDFNFNFRLRTVLYDRLGSMPTYYVSVNYYAPARHESGDFSHYCDTLLEARRFMNRVRERAEFNNVTICYYRIGYYDAFDDCVIERG